jgi:3-phenylpropionate/trans-cinnamate dioxygenase ferredoxin reductase subunit
VVVSDDPSPPYDRPPLSKGYLHGATAGHDIALKPEAFYSENRVELLLGRRAESLDLAGRSLLLDGGERVPFDRLLLATGARPRRLAAPGAGLEGVHYLRTLEDARALRAELLPGRRLVVVGGGFIGLEVAASARTLGLEVTVLEALEAPLARVLGPDLGRLFVELHRSRGADVLTSEGVAALRGRGRVSSVLTTRERVLDADLVVVGIGVTPAVALAESAGLAARDGVLVDERCQTSAPEVFAAGDVARFWHPALGRELRVEHWDNAIRQGTAAALNMLDRDHPYSDVPWFWSDQYDLTFQYTGLAPEWDRVVTRGSVDAMDFVAFYMLDGRVRAAFGAGRARDIRRSMALIASGARVDLARLEDPATDLRRLAREPTGGRA